MRTRPMRLALVGVVLGLSAACQDLDVINPNEPDRERALADPQLVEALIAGTYNVLHNSAIHGNASNANRGGYQHVPHTFPSVATEMTADIVISAALTLIEEPRVNPVDNQPNPADITGQWGPRALWQGLMETASNATDGLRFIHEARAQGVELLGAQTARAEAFAKFMQGWAWGYAAIHYDQVVVVDETLALPPTPEGVLEQARQNLIPWEQALERALQSLGDAARIARENDISFPDAGTRLWFATPDPMTADQFARAANTLAARILVLSAPTPEARRQIDWNRVLQLTADGVIQDFEVVLAPGFRSSRLILLTSLTGAGCNCPRWDNRLIGQADISGAYQQWVNTPLQQRDRFDIVTPDRRIAGPAPAPGEFATGVTLTHGHHGAYTRYRPDNNGFRDAAGTYLKSSYQWYRHHFQGFDSNTGNVKVVTADENNLLRAEALLRTGDLAGAAALINISRTRSHTLPDGNTYPGLPAVTVNGAPHSAPGADDCVPRTDDGACGDLMVALRYERMIELAGYDSVRGLADSRGFGLLPDGTFLRMPVPGNELQVFALAIYTIGGVSDPVWGARYAPVTMTDR